MSKSAAASAPASTSAASAQAGGLATTPSCGGTVTDAQTEGPYFKPSSPERSSLLEPGMGGTPLTIMGSVLTPDCRPVARALLDFWQADDKGQYDNQGFRLRGHELTDDAGWFSMQTIIPGLYPGRTRHIHVKVQVAKGSVLTTQLYFPGEPRNNSDSIFDSKLVLPIQDASGGTKQAVFNFVVKAV